ncbi:hypothetical protein TetV_083 [Tetraselmis virus 1]|uniref:Uncharacterized protein n=1 Tax=Tetraselmis virus 1 TaxID=2060617 RepID=A0A2P0VMP2_9VIRU|nr:hypothetical protein QJ968_gp083 [Tetraselmis virus 1]AUF82175.1 hypothetical protein TetV_083 [Tetraselmis virus 1]
MLSEERLVQLGSLKTELKTVKQWKSLMKNLESLIESWYNQDNEHLSAIQEFENAKPSNTQLTDFITKSLLWPGPYIENDQGVFRFSCWPLSKKIIQDFNWLSLVTSPRYIYSNESDELLAINADTTRDIDIFDKYFYMNSIKYIRIAWRTIQELHSKKEEDTRILENLKMQINRIPLLASNIGYFESIEHLVTLLSSHPQNDYLKQEIINHFNCDKL